MERAAQQCFNWIKDRLGLNKKVFIFCGKGNNGGDGLAIARMLLHERCHVSVYILEFGKPGSEDFQTNLRRLHEGTTDIHFIQSTENFPIIAKDDIVIDALFGSGLNKALDGLPAELVRHINQSHVTIISIDVPSGLFIDESSTGNTIIHATYTLSFQCYKAALLVQENAPFIGEVHVLDIGLFPGFLTQVTGSPELLNEKMIRQVFKPRNRFGHKGNFGHALLVGGSYGKMGAIVLATKACLSSGAGLTTTLVPNCGHEIMQTTVPEAMVLVDEEEMHLTKLPDDIEKFSVVAIGPGMGTKAETQKLLSFIIRRYRKPLVLDADGLNCLALQKELLGQLPPYSILTPHPKEFDRLFGEHKNDFDRIATARQQAEERKVVIVLKGHHTFIATHEGNHYFNSTGNAGMAKGGSGDVLTGIITSLLCQGYSSYEAALIGVYIHGWSGDFAARRYSKEAMLPSHSIQCLSDVFLALNKKV